jgi:16S rRNA C1402 (ribose-2'-O) methylase RsmI
LPKLIELKLASGMSAPHRLKDLADVLELVRALSLPRDLTASLDSTVRAKYEELWEAAQAAERE